MVFGGDFRILEDKSQKLGQSCSKRRVRVRVRVRVRTNLESSQFGSQEADNQNIDISRVFLFFFLSFFRQRG